MAQDPSGAVLLTEGQRRHLTTTLAQLEDHLSEIVALTRGARSPGPRILLKVLNDLPHGFGEATREDISRAKATLAELVATFDLAPPTASPRQTVQALVTHGLVMVEDSVSRRLRSYGPVHPDLPRVLDPLLERLHEHFLGLARVLPAPIFEESPSDLP
jgi:hypothetical protein